MLPPRSAAPAGSEVATTSPGDAPTDERGTLVWLVGAGRAWPLRRVAAVVLLTPVVVALLGRS